LVANGNSRTAYASDTMLKNYFKTAIRNLSRNRIYSAINISGLSLGLACAMLILLYVKDESSYDRFHTGVDHIYRIYSQVSDLGNRQLTSPDGTKNPAAAGEIHKMGITGFLQGPRFTEKIPAIRSFVRVRVETLEQRRGADVVTQEVAFVDSNFFSVFSFPLLRGDPKTCLLGTHAIVLSEDAAIKQFGTVNALGKTVMVRKADAFDPYTVTAVAKRCPQNSSIKFETLMPLHVDPSQNRDGMNWFNFFLDTYVVLAPHADLKNVETQMQAVYLHDAENARKEAAEKYGTKDRAVYKMQPFTAMHLDKDLPSNSDPGNPMYAYILSGISAFVLLIACINFVNLTIARSLQRAKEIGIRKVVGGSRKQLMFQFLGESLVLCLIAFLLAIVLVKWLLPVFNELSNKALSLSYLFDARLVTAYLVLFLFTGFLAGFYPAMVLSGYDPVQTLYSRFRLVGKNLLQKSLVVVQFTLASFLIAATLIIYSQFNYLTTEKLGYDDTNLVLVDKRDLKHDQARMFRSELMKDPDILGMTAKDAGYSFTGAKINGDSTLGFAYATIDESFLPLLKIPIVSGRNFSPAYPSDSSHSVLVNETFVARAGWKHPIGQEVNFWYNNNEKYRVVGVIRDYHFQPLSEKIGPQLLTMKESNDYGTAIIKIKPNGQQASLQYIGKLYRSLFPISPYSHLFQDQVNRRNYEAEAKWKQIMLYSAILTIFISCIGLFGLSVLSAERRTKEIGIRKVLGASVNSVVTILSKDFIKLVIISLLMAMPLAWMAAGKWLANYPYRISVGWEIFAVAALLVVLIALATVSFQAVKAAVANPVKSLRSE
jgi:putative ABC transport system permease protein